MSKPIKFGRQAAQRPAFEINDLSFASTPLSLAEEQQLSQAGNTDDDDASVIGALVGVLADLLNARKGAGQQSVDAEWLMDNLAPSDLEGIIEHLRSGE